LLFHVQQGRTIHLEESPGTALNVTFQPLSVTGSPKFSSTAQVLIDPGPLLVSVPSAWKPLPQLLVVATVQLAAELPPLELDELLELLLDDELELLELEEDELLLDELDDDELELLEEELEPPAENTKCCAETAGTV
jgi:hypothetical protein